MLRTGAVLLALAASGCSILLTTPRREGRPRECGDTLGHLGLDVAGTALSGVVTYAGLENMNDGDFTPAVGALVGFAGTLGYLISALRGLNEYRACHE